MFDQLLDLVRSHAGKSIIDNPDIPNERNEEAIQDASFSITNGLQGILSGGGFKDILKMFSGNNTENSQITKGISGNFIQSLVGKFGLNDQQAVNISDNIVPGVLNDLVRKTKDSQDNSFDIQGIFNSLSGGQTSGFNMQGLLNKMKSGKLDLDGDGDTDLQDLMSIFSGKSGYIMNKINSLL